MEKYIEIKEYPNYEVSDLGNIRNKKTNRILKTKFNNCGYKQLKLSKNGINKMYSVHRIVAEAFIINIESKPFVNHKNGNKSDNRVENLEWVTRSENDLHAYKLGLRKVIKNPNYGSKNGNSKLNEIKVKEIREKYLSGRYTQQKLAEEYNVSQHTINGIVLNKIWIAVV